MKLFDSARSLFGLVNVEVITNPKSHAQIRVSGIKGLLLAKDLQYYYNTIRVSKYIFDKITSNSVTFPAFFALEVLTIMEKIVSSPRTNYTSRHTADIVRKALLSKTWLERLDAKSPQDYDKALDLSKLRHFKLQPLEYQSEWLTHFDNTRYALALNGALLDGTPGSGKTMMGLYISECAPVDVSFIITPKNALESVWVNTLQNKLTYQPTIWRSDKPSQYKNERYCVVHYEALGAALAMVMEMVKQGKRCSIVVDESHYFNEMSSERTKLLIEFCKASQSEFIVLQSGTPFKAIGAEIVPALHCIDATFSEDLAERFKKLYAASATEALQLLRRRLGYITYVVPYTAVKLAEPIIENIQVKSPNGSQFTLEFVAAEMAQFVNDRTQYYRSRKAQDERDFHAILQRFISNPKNRTVEYEQYLEDLKVIRRGDLRAAKDNIVRANAYERTTIIPALSAEDAKLFKEVKTIYKYVVMKIQGECLGRVLGKKRAECSVEIARCVDYEKYIESTTKKTLVFTTYVDALQAAKDRTMELDYKPMTIYGETNKNLPAILAQFEKDEALNPMIATYHSLSTAVPMTTCDVLLAIDVPYRSYVLTQAIARIRRLGADTQTYVYIANLDTDGVPNLSTRTIDILKWSQSQIERITGVAPPFEISDAKVSLEAMALAKEALNDDHFVEIDFEKAFMANLV